MAKGNTETQGYDLEWLDIPLQYELNFQKRADQAEIRGFILGWLMGVAFAAALLVSIWS